MILSPLQPNLQRAFLTAIAAVAACGAAWGQVRAPAPLVQHPKPDGNVSTAGLTPDKDGWIALAPLVQADRDLKDAGWKWDGNSAAFSAGKPRALVSIPVRIAGSYELQTRITITRAKEVTAIYLPITATRAVVLGMRGDRGNSESETATIELTGLKPEAEQPGDLSMKIGDEYALSVSCSTGPAT